ncbi:TIGR04086 family membrane protein [Lutispora thermophila]|uniref:Putative membrane protein, TIGR04086 family n=1 Tax=Lutispora thermophila DSM 19022 TaxID=1122184 RepID=A0A1M6HPE1_9FIRM|nr:TIGR04086 family membrane protein [Lutispora thermophila]SHJ24059.1 putative membrane protein, TIGR04086 family [Lutispora thermophila DSM 19022]
MRSLKRDSIKLHEKQYENKIIIFAKSIILALIISLVSIIIYAIVLSLTSVSDGTMSLITQSITMISIVAAAIYCGRKIKSKGWLYGMIVGIIFILMILPLSIILGQVPVFDKYFIGKIIMACLVGIVGGIIGVNL